MIKNKQLEITFTRSMFEELRSHLLANSGMEQAAFVFAAPSTSLRTVRLLAHEVIYLSPHDFQQQSGIFLSIESDRAQETLHRCLEEGWTLIETHSYPFYDRAVSYSNIDIENERGNFENLADKIPNIYYATIVFRQNSLDAHIYDRKNRVVKNVDRIKIIGDPQEFISPAGIERMQPLKFDKERFDRQVIAFGATGQNLLTQIRVGIVGLGGIGSHLAQQLAHLGVQDFLLIDHDHVETTNLNRLVGSTLKDALRKTFKTEVAKRLIRKINGWAQVETQCLNVADRKAAEALKGVDFIFGAADNDGCRLMLNRIAVQHLIPYLDIGTGIEASDEEITACGGQIRLVLPGHGFCLNCINSIDRVQAGFDLMSPEQTNMRQNFGYGLGPLTAAPAVIFLNGTLASLAVGELMNLLTGYKQPCSYLFLDMLKPSLLRVQTKRQIDCVTCSSEAVLAKGDLEPFPTSVTNEQLPLPGKSS